MKKAVIAVFDVGKTNKKLFLFDESYRIVFERVASFAETTDEDGYPCENLNSLRLWVFDSLEEVFSQEKFDIRAINFSAYGASLVYVDEEGSALAPLYNYLKPYPEALLDAFYSKYGGRDQLASETASPVLGSLNSAMQLYRVKQEQEELFSKTRYALHLPQFLSSLITGKFYSDITSIGCHTHLWDFRKSTYHQWVEEEGILPKLAPLVGSDSVFPALFPQAGVVVGPGLHDSSAALIPYLLNFHEPFVLISTGTWCISFNPFNSTPLSRTELTNDCLCYLQYGGRPVKASRVFAGHIHETEVKRIAAHFNTSASRYRQLKFNSSYVTYLDRAQAEKPFPKRELSDFETDEKAYHSLIAYLVMMQKRSTELVSSDSGVKRIFVDGGFSKNSIYMNYLSAAFPDMEVFGASIPQATAIGTAMSIHRSWNKKAFPTDLIELKYYAAPFEKS